MKFDSTTIGFIVWYGMWIFVLWPFDKVDFTIGGLIGGFWWAWLPVLFYIAFKQRRKKKGSDI